MRIYKDDHDEDKDYITICIIFQMQGAAYPKSNTVHTTAVDAAYIQQQLNRSPILVPPAEILIT